MKLRELVLHDIRLKDTMVDFGKGVERCYVVCIRVCMSVVV